MSKSAPKHFFSKYASVQTPRSLFNLSFVNTTTINSDYLYPINCLDVLPGDTFTLDMSSFMRLLSPIDVPMMDNLHCTYHFWYVPMRLVWKHTKEFFGEKDRENPDIEYTIPQVRFHYSTSGSGKTDFSKTCQSLTIGDYLGYPIHDDVNISSKYSYDYTANALPFRCYNLIWDTWYRDEQRQDYSYYNVGEETDDYDKYKLLKRGKRFDYFTSSLLEPQIGENVTIPIGNTAPVLPYNLDETTGKPIVGTNVDLMNEKGLGFTQQTMSSYAYLDTSSGTPTWKMLTDANTGNNNHYVHLGVQTDTDGRIPAGSLGYSVHNSLTGEGMALVAPASLYADLRNVTSSSIIALRQAFQLQAYQEIMARSGTSYTEYIYGQFGVISPDARLQRPEFLGGCTFDLSCMPVVQNSSSTEDSKQGNLSAIISGGTSKSIFTRSFTEHGYIIILMNIYSDLTYYQGMPRAFSRKTPLDFALPVFANLTDQAIPKKEILFMAGNSTPSNPVDEKNNEDIFGYAERYAEYKFSQNTLTGLVRPNAKLSVGYWTLAQQFDNTLSNNEKFIESSTPIERIVSVTDQPQFIVNHKFIIKCTRCLPMYSDTMKWFMKG